MLNEKGGLLGNQACPFLASLRRNPTVTIRELQDETRLSESGVKKIIRQLKAEGLIRRIGGDKGGHWECV